MSKPTPAPITTTRPLTWLVILGVTLGSLTYILLGLMPPAAASDQFKLDAAGRVPILDHGRVKPLDSLARVSLMIISGRQEYTDADGEQQPAIRWLFDVMTCVSRNRNPKMASTASLKTKAYRIEHKENRALLGLADRDGIIFSYEDLQSGGEKRLEEFQRALNDLDPQSKDPVVQEHITLAIQTRAYEEFAPFETPHRVFRIDNDQVLSLLGLSPRFGYRYGFDEILPRMGQLLREAKRINEVPEKNRNLYEDKMFELNKHMELYMNLARLHAPTLHLIGPNYKGEPYKTYQSSVAKLNFEDRRSQQDHPAEFAFELMRIAYAMDNKKVFNEAVDSYTKHLAEVDAADVSNASMESNFNYFAPFYRCTVLYAIILVLAAVSWLWRDPLITRFAFWMLAMTLLIHTIALILRMVIQGRPPVTNLYSSAVFIGWAAVLVALVIEWKARNAIAVAVASAAGFSTLLIAHYLGGSGDTLEMMQAVLDTNFWLATHVTSVTIGYAATFIAGLFGILFLWMMMVTVVCNGLRDPRPMSPGQLVLFFISALVASVFVALVFDGMIYGLYYRAYRDVPTGAAPLVWNFLLGVGAVAFAVYLLVLRLNRVGKTEPLPKRLRFMESFTMTENNRKVLSWMMYGTVCFATLFSFVGTVLGGIWADYSWGRFWGWDPKENGALLIVIMNSMILHARWGGMVKDRGIAVLTLVGNMVTMWSWFGTNQLGIGLHAYGFNNALVLLCRWFWLGQLGLIGLALLPYTNWREYKPVLEFENPEGTPQTKKEWTKGKRGSQDVQPA